jgi:hypothetical protein
MAKKLLSDRRRFIVQEIFHVIGDRIRDTGIIPAVWSACRTRVEEAGYLFEVIGGKFPELKHARIGSPGNGLFGRDLRFGKFLEYFFFDVTKYVVFASEFVERTLMVRDLRGAVFVNLPFRIHAQSLQVVL